MFKFDETPKYCINLPKRTDRLKSVKKEFNRYNLDVQTWGAVNAEDLVIPMFSMKKVEYNAPGIYACMLSHYNLVKYAKENNYEYIVVFEDDIVFCDDFYMRINYIETLDLDFDMFYLGGHYDNEGDVEKTSNEYIFKCKNIAGTYGYIMKNTCYNFVLQNMSYNYGADEFYNEELIKKYKALAFIPFLIDHNDGISDVAERLINYPTHKHFKKKL